MKIKICDDVFDVVKRVKEIYEGYEIFYDTNKCKFELYDMKNIFSYCLTIPYECLDTRTIDLILCSSIVNIDNIINSIDKNNKEIETNNKENVRNLTDYMVREIYDFSSNSSKNFCNDAFSTKWR